MNLSERLSVSQLSSILSECFKNPVFSNIHVYGEIYSVKQSGKYVYIDLGDEGNKETNSPLLKVVFVNYYGSSFADYKVGDIVLVSGSLSYYSHGSSISLWCKTIELLSSQNGKNLLAKKKTLEKLDKLGYLNPERKREIPRYCKKVAIVTSKTGAAYQDILNTLKSRFPVSTVLFDSIVQGDGAAKSMLKALEHIEKYDDFDCVILGRGGGSKTDLSCFDDENLAIKIAEFKIPVITCIGHTIDTAIADRVSDKQAITPTEGASFINPPLSDIQEEMLYFNQQADEYMMKLLSSYKREIENLSNKAMIYSPLNQINRLKDKVSGFKTTNDNILSSLLSEQRLKLVHNSTLLKEKILTKVEIIHKEIEKYSEVCESLYPKDIIEKGYIQALHDGKIIKKKSDLKADDELYLSFADGKVKVKVLED